MADTINDSTFVTSSTYAVLDCVCEWEARIINEPTDKCRYGYRKRTFSQDIN